MTEHDHETAATREVVMRYHLSWKDRDIDAVLALYHPDVEYNDYFQNRRLHLAELGDYVRATMPSGPDEFLVHSDRIRVDGDTAFIQYSLRLGHSGTFRTSEAITVRDGLIWRINEYALLIQAKAEPGDRVQRPAASRLGLSARQLSLLARDLEDYFQHSQPYLDPALDLHQVAAATGYTRNQISYLLNQMLGQSFYQYVNQARLQHLLAQLERGRPRRASTRWPSPPGSTRCRPSTAASASTRGSRRRPTSSSCARTARRRSPHRAPFACASSPGVHARTTTPAPASSLAAIRTFPTGSPAMPAWQSISLWMDQLDEPLTPRPALGGSLEVDVAIIGAGYTGLWTAYYLKREAPSCASPSSRPRSPVSAPAGATAAG